MKLLKGALKMNLNQQETDLEQKTNLPIIAIKEVTWTAIVTRADGTIENLGVISSNKEDINLQKET